MYNSGENSLSNLPPLWLNPLFLWHPLIVVLTFFGTFHNHDFHTFWFVFIFVLKYFPVLYSPLPARLYTMYICPCMMGCDPGHRSSLSLLPLLGGLPLLVEGLDICGEWLVQMDDVRPLASEFILLGWFQPFQDP